LFDNGQFPNRTIYSEQGFAESHQFFLDENKWKTCLDCSTKQPLTLSKLCCLTAILKLNWYEVEGTSLSSWMVKRLVATALTRLDDLDLKEQERVCSSISVLLPHWPNEELNLSSYGPSPSCFKFVVELTLKFFLEDFEGKRNLRLERLVMSDYDSDDLFYYSAGKLLLSLSLLLFIFLLLSLLLSINMLGKDSKPVSCRCLDIELEAQIEEMSSLQFFISSVVCEFSISCKVVT